ncbi:MAG: hypothetical protein AABY32_06945 [Nanoarchaeota archaeon]
MVTIENITRKEEERLNKIVRTQTLLKEFFDNISITNTSTLIAVREKEKINPFLYIAYFGSKHDKMELCIPEELIPKYYEKTLAFAKEYEKKFKTEVTLQTDYSK